jgi:hypothetical protein
MPELGLYVYGLVSDGALATAPELPGIDGSHAVECVTQGELCALVSRVSLDQFDDQRLREHLADMAWVERTARRHQQVLESVLGQCTPLPMRLCTLYNDEQGLLEMLARQQESLSAALADLAGKLEWGVQAFSAARRRQPSSNPGATPATTGTAYLQQKLASRRAGEQADANLEAICDRLHTELSSFAVASRLGPLQRPEVSARQSPMILNASYLVANEQRERFGSRFAELGDEHAEDGVELQLTGPWPPYNFVPTAAAGGARQ